MEGMCRYAGISRQAYYQGTRRRMRREVDEEAIVAQVKFQRRFHPRMGVRKLGVTIGPVLVEMGISIGRDRLFALLGKHGLLIERKRRWVKTTDSRHGMGVWPNRIRHIVPTMANQVWVSDLTYIRTAEGFMYLSLVTDAYSRKIVGYCVNDTLEAQGCVKALRMALKGLPDGACPIHHSDRGLQYCCREYVGILQARQCPISMTEMNHCYENAKAERVNGILKQEYALGETFGTKQQAVAAAHQAVVLYNQYRPHRGLNYQTPQAIHVAA